MKDILILILALAIPPVACVPTHAKYVASSDDFTSQHCLDNYECVRNQSCFLIIDSSAPPPYIHDGLCVWDH
jgi:hypothetical protein